MWTFPGDWDLSQIVVVIRQAILDFPSLQWRDTASRSNALILAFPNLDPRQAKILDAAHYEMKDEVVQSGLMFAQFHYECDVRSARNVAVKVGIAPVPMISLRNMAFHDLLFLSDQPSWARKYESIFGWPSRAQLAGDSAMSHAVAKARGVSGRDR